MGYRNIIAVLLVIIAGPTFAQHQQVLPPIGGPGGGAFQAACVRGEILVGVELRVGDDVDAIRPVCATPTSPTNISYSIGRGSFYGGDSGRPSTLTCPAAAPAVNGIEVGYEGQVHVIINNVHLFCSLALPDQPLTNYPSQVFDGPAIIETDHDLFKASEAVPLKFGRAWCPPGLVAVGVTGRSGSWLDALSLICDVLPYDPSSWAGQPGKTLGRVNPGDVPKPSASICDAARDALGRASPAAPDLVTQCRNAGGTATPAISNADLEQKRLQGEFACSMDDAAGALRNRLDGGARRGFEIGIGIWDHDIVDGSGKHRYRDALTNPEKQGFDLAAAYALPKNQHPKLIDVGSAIARADAEVAKARDAEADSFFQLGFDIASGLFGDPAAGAEGSTVVGTKALDIRNALNDAGRRGFDASTKLHLSRHYR